MFVSPPPTYLVRQTAHKKHRKRDSDTASQSDIQQQQQLQMQEMQQMQMQQMQMQQMQMQQQQQEQFHLPSISSRKEANFVSAPAEYADRARIEIRKRLLQQQPSSNRQSSASSSNSSSSASSHHRDTESLVSDNASSYQSSIFSAPTTIGTQGSALSAATSAAAAHQQKYVTHVSLEEALPQSFYDMYAPEIFAQDPSKILYNGRPSFTKRELLDWDLNDIRSLLIIEQPKPHWGNHLPEIVTSAPSESSLPKFRFILLPLCSSDEFIIDTLVNSDLYVEANLDYEFKLTSARYTVAAARKRHEQITGAHEPQMNLSKPEWRNIIENYLLNIAVEAQCRFDFKQQCSDFKKWKAQQTNLKRPDMPPPSVIPLSMRNGNNSSGGNSTGGGNALLKKALMKNMQMKSLQQPQAPSTAPGPDGHPQKVSLTKEEKASIWSHCQAQVYQRLDLDWKPDAVR